MLGHCCYGWALYFHTVAPLHLNICIYICRFIVSFYDDLATASRYIYCVTVVVLHVVGAIVGCYLACAVQAIRLYAPLKGIVAWYV